MAGVNKVDLSLDDIIKLNKQKGGRGRGRGRGKPAGQNGGGATPGGAAAKNSAGRKSRGRGQDKVQRLKQNARKTLKARKKNQPPGVRVQGQAGAEQKNTSTLSSSIKLRLGVRGRGRGRGRATNIVDGATEGITTPKPGRRLKAIRALKAQKANTRGRGIGRGEQTILKGKQAVVRGRGRGNRANQQVRSATSSTVTTAMGPGRGRGDRRGRGRGQRRPEAPESAASVSVFATPAPQFDPVGINIPLDFCADQHTSKSLNNRFTPQVAQRSMQRMVRGGRSVSFYT